jgi:hypothetical protein
MAQEVDVLPGSDVNPGTCLAFSTTRLYSISVGIDYRANAVVYTMAILAEEQ